ncbi:hypothetical protein V5E38_01445 [Rossellomorea sp. GAMAL-10_SWC]
MRRVTTLLKAKNEILHTECEKKGVNQLLFDLPIQWQIQAGENMYERFYEKVKDYFLKTIKPLGLKDIQKLNKEIVKDSSKSIELVPLLTNEAMKERNGDFLRAIHKKWDKNDLSFFEDYLPFSVKVKTSNYEKVGLTTKKRRK